MLMHLFLEEKRNRAMNQSDVLNSVKKIIYNNSSKKLTTSQEKLLELGLNFGVMQKKFPLIEYCCCGRFLSVT